MTVFTDLMPTGPRGTDSDLAERPLCGVLVGHVPDRPT